MKTLGIIGGMSWESTLLYYRGINAGVATRRGGLHSASLLLHSLDFAEVAALQRRGDWDAAAALLADAARGLRHSGADAVLIATNTMHKVAPQVQAACGLPLLHIGDATGAALRAAGIERAGLLGTRFTMEQPFLRDWLLARHGVATVVPDDDDRATVHRVIFEELCRGVASPASRAECIAVIERLARAGAQAVVLGCTELCLLLDVDALPLPGFDSTQLHVGQALDWLLAGEVQAMVAAPEAAGVAA